MKKIINFYCIIFILFSSTCTYAQTQACQFGPNASIESIKKIILEMHHNEDNKHEGGLSFPHAVPLNTTVNFESTSDESNNTDNSRKVINYEALLRPQKNYTFNLLNLIMFKLNKNKNLMYVCLNYDSEKLAESHLTIYFLSVKGLDTKPKNSNIFTNIFSYVSGSKSTSPSVDDEVAKLTRIPIEFFALHLITQDVTNWLEEIPIIGTVFKIPGTAIKFSGDLISGFTGSLGGGVEKIDITHKEIIFSNFVNANNTEDTHVIYRFNLEENGISIF